MATISSLLRSAATRQQKVLDQQDAVAAFEWQNSAQTYGDYQNYAKYLVDRSNTTTDASKQLTYAGKLRTANNDYVGNEIQRQTQDVMEGRSTNTDKRTKLIDFYYQAQDAGNQNLAQNLRSQIDSLDITIQNERQAAQTLARGMAAEQVTSVQDYVSVQQDIIKQWGDVYAKYGAAGLNDSLQQYAEKTGLPTAPNYFDVIAGIVGQPDANGNYPPDSILGALQTSATNLDPINANKLKADMNKIVNGDTKFSMPGIAGGVSYTDIIDALDAQRTGQNIYNIGQDSNGKNIFIKNKLDNYVWGQDNTGQMRLIKTYNPAGDNFDKSNVLDRNAKGQYLDSHGNVTKDVNQAARVSYKTLLENAGFRVIGSNSDGTLRVAQNSSIGGPLDVTGGGEFDVALDDSGNLRFIHTDASGQKNLYELSFGVDQNGNPTGNGGDARLHQLSAADTSIFGDTGYLKSTASSLGVSMIKQIIGQSDVNFSSNIPSTINPVAGYGGFNPVARPLNTSDILAQGAALTRIQATANPQSASANPQFQAPPQLQATPTFDLNRTVVPGNSALKVSNGPPTPRLAVAPPAPTPQITNVGVAQPTQHITGVGNAGPQPTLHVGF